MLKTELMDQFNSIMKSLDTKIEGKDVVWSEYYIASKLEKYLKELKDKHKKHLVTQLLDNGRVRVIEYDSKRVTCLETLEKINKLKEKIKGLEEEAIANGKYIVNKTYRIELDKKVKEKQKEPVKSKEETFKDFFLNNPNNF